VTTAALRARLGLAQGDLARLVGVHWLTVSKWERGKATPAPFQAALLAALAAAPAGSGPRLRELIAGEGVPRALYEALRWWAGAQPTTRER
jgi:putative transcriptional regulator